MDIMEDEVQRNVARRQDERKMVTLEDGNESREMSKVEGESRREGRLIEEKETKVMTGE